MSSSEYQKSRGNKAGSSARPRHKPLVRYSDKSPPSSPEEIDGSLPSALSSRLSVNAVCDIVENFDDFKRWLVTEAGFGGTLHFHRQKKLNLKFSAWIMSKVDVKNREIDLGPSRKLRFWDSDVYKVLGAPCGSRCVREPDKHINSEGVQFIKNAIGMDSVDSAHSMKAAEEFLRKDITPSSSKIEQDCFKIAYVIFVMGNFFAPSTKHDYSNIDFWYALADAESIQEFNWCEYILEDLMKAVSKLKIEISLKASKAHLAACHFFLQIFYLDNLDLGGLNKKHSYLPRIGDFSYEAIKRMVIMSTSVGSGDISYTAAVLRAPGLVAYTRAKYDDPKPPMVPLYMNNFSATSPIAKLPASSSTPVTAARTDNAAVLPRSSCSSMGALDFSRHLTNAHPNLPPGGISLVMKEFMARQALNTNTLRNTQITDMASFADKLLAVLASKCVCCSARGFDNCILKEESEKTSSNAIMGRRLIMDAEQDTGTTPMSTITAKRQTQAPPVLDHHPKRINIRHNKPALVPSPQAPIKTQHPKTRCPLEQISAVAGDIAAAIRLIYEELDCSPGRVIFGDEISHNHEKIYFYTDSAWANHWFPSPDAYFKLGLPGYARLTDYISRLPTEEVTRPWVIHDEPRYINIPGIVIRKQLIGNHSLDHEMGSVIVRRLNQIAREEASNLQIDPWSLALEPDFAICSLANQDCASIAHIRDQFVTEGANINTCWLFHVPMFSPEGWCNFAFEMPNKTIHVMDPTSGPRGIAAGRKKKLEFAADKILKSLFRCITTFFTEWPVADDNWSKKFPILMDTNYSRDQSGICTTFFMTHFGGSDMKLGVSKDNINLHRQMILHQVMLLEGNGLTLAQDHLSHSSIEELALSD